MTEFKLRLLLIDYEFPPNQHGGIGTYNFALANWLGNNGHHVFVITRKNDSKLEVIQTKFGQVCRIPVFTAPDCLNRFMPYLNYLFFSVMALRQAKKIINGFKPDIIEIPSSGGTGFFFIMNRLKLPPIIVRFHGSMGNPPIDHNAENILKQITYSNFTRFLSTKIGELFRKPLWWLERYVLKNAKYVTCPSHFSSRWLRNQIKGINSEKLFIVPNGINISGSDFRKNQDISTDGNYCTKKQVVFVGRLTPQKGVYILLQAIPELFSEDQEIKLLLIGPFNDNGIKNRINDLCHQFPGRITVTGRLSHDKVLQLVSTSLALVHPTLYETSSMVIIEALSMGIPVIGSNTGPLPEMIEDGETGFLFPVGNVKELAKAMLRMASLDKKTIQKMKRLTIKKVKEEFDFNKTAKSLLIYYSNIINNKAKKTIY